MKESEVFTDIHGFEGMYQVSNLGKIMSCDRIVCNGRFEKGKIMKPTKTKKGYLRVDLCKDGKCHSYQVHRLVALAFIPNIHNKPCIDHINGIKDDNRVENLRWCTNRENIHFAMENNMRHIFSPNKSTCARMVAKLDMNGIELKVYPSLSEAARQNGIKSFSKISAVCNGERHSAGGFKWEYRSEMPSVVAKRDMKKKGVSIPIIQCDLNGAVIANFNSIGEAVRKTNIHLTCIMKSLRNKDYSFNGFMFRYK